MQKTKNSLLGIFSHKETTLSPLNSFPSAFSNHEPLISCYKLKKRLSSETDYEKNDPLQTHSLLTGRQAGRQEGRYLGTQTNQGTNRHPGRNVIGALRLDKCWETIRLNFCNYSA